LSFSVDPSPDFAPCELHPVSLDSDLSNREPI
jgi:hypothetical protein